MFFFFFSYSNFKFQQFNLRTHPYFNGISYHYKVCFLELYVNNFTDSKFLNKHGLLFSLILAMFSKTHFTRINRN